ncbi:MAG: hypothetical protein IJZ29_05695 [Clostridia bacterium]|nr:hypothetical protein [Clostridia bacterium]
MAKTTTRKQTIAIIVLSVLLLALLAVNITFAYFTATDTTTNNQEITFDTLTITVNDDTDWTIATSSTETLDTLLPGSEIQMNGSVVLAGADAYLKVSFNVSTPTVTDVTAIESIETALGSVLKAQDVGTWEEVGGVWYCVTPNTAGTVIDFADGTVEFPLEEIGNVWQGQSITIGYTVEAIQSANVTLTGDTNAEKAASLASLFESVDTDTGLVA